MTTQTETPAKPATKTKPTRARLRYLKFIESDADCTFGEWLRNQWYRPAEPAHDPRSEL